MTGDGIEATRLTQRAAHHTVLALNRTENDKGNPLLCSMLGALRGAVPTDEPSPHAADAPRRRAGRRAD
ncbi:hypothetical protein [Streptomyces sp. NPDC002855]|uniref:hypothetical protein n=1 Tax=Streptomyces sp. NPDC002855 TaxID=3154437 RepID=UPI00331703CF